MKEIINIQLSVFGSFEHVKATPDIVSQLIPLFDNQFMPSVFEMKIFDAANNSVENENRLRLISTDKKNEIVFLPNRIDNNFTIECSPGKTAAFNLVDTHRDICGITYKTLFTLLTAYKNAVDNDKCHRCTAADLRRLAKEALMKNQIDIELAGDKLVKDLEGL